MNVKKINLSDQAINLWNYCNPSMPFYIGMIGHSDCKTCNDDNYFVKRTNSQILAIEYIKNGSGTLVIEDQTHQLNPNSLFFLKKNTTHLYYPDKNNLWEKEWILFDGELANKFIDWYIPHNIYCIENYNADYFFSAINDLAQKYKNNYGEFIKYATLAFCNFIIDLNYFINHNSLDVANKVKNIMDNNLHKNISIHDIANQLHYSTNYIIRAFKKKFGITPAKYYVQKKIELAMLQLRIGELSVCEISDNLNFVDQHYFCNVFKLYTGLTPSQYKSKYHI